jgi:hypothetical protein
MRSRPGHLRIRSVVVSLAVVATSLLVPAVASASYFMSLGQAEQHARKTVHAVNGASIDWLDPGCWPSYRSRNAPNRARRWHLWTCGWTARLAKPDGSSAICVGTVQITGKRHGWSARPVQPVRCKTLTRPPATPTPGPSPTPAPGSTPAPVPSPGPATQPTPPPAPLPSVRQQQMIDQARIFGVQRARELINLGWQGSTGTEGAFYYGQVQFEQCVFLTAARVRCPVYLWWDALDQDRNFYTYESREIFQAFVFVEDLGTSVGFNDVMEPDSALSFDVTRPYFLICSDWYDLTPPRTCSTTSRVPIQYPSSGYPRPTS